MSAQRAAAAQPRYAVRPASVITRPENPAAAASAGRSCMRRNGSPPVIRSNFIGGEGSGAPTATTGAAPQRGDVVGEASRQLHREVGVAEVRVRPGLGRAASRGGRR